MDDSAIERAKQRVEDRADTAAVDALLARTREQLESLLSATEQAAATMPQRVDVITAGWQGVDERLGRVEGAAARLETAITRLEQGIEQRGGAIVYRIEDRRPETAPTES